MFCEVSRNLPDNFETYDDFKIQMDEVCVLQKRFLLSLEGKWQPGVTHAVLSS